MQQVNWWGQPHLVPILLIPSPHQFSSTAEALQGLWCAFLRELAAGWASETREHGFRKVLGAGNAGGSWTPVHCCEEPGLGLAAK